MNNFTSEIIITGAKKFKGTVDGNDYDSTTVYALTELAGEGVGFTSGKFQWGKSDNFMHLATLEFPFKCNAQFKLEVSGNNTRPVLQNIDLKTIKILKELNNKAA